MSGAELGTYIRSAGWIIDMSNASDKAALQIVPAAPLSRDRDQELCFTMRISAHFAWLGKSTVTSDSGGRYGIM